MKLKSSDDEAQPSGKARDFDSRIRWSKSNRLSQTAKINAEKEKEVALIAANKEKEVEEVNAEKVLIAAEAEAEANRIISESLTHELIEKMQIEKWNGAYPKVVGDGTAIITDLTGE